jgi:GT2 family glycosyltransferase
VAAQSATELNPGAAVITRPRVHGKFLQADGEKLYIRGVTYGPFAPGADGHPYDPARARSDFPAMAAAGVNTVRLYTSPPRWLLELASVHGLRVLAGLAWEQHVTFLDDRRLSAAILERVREQVATVAGHPALLGWAVGNEIPAPIVRWHGPAAVRGFIQRLVDVTRVTDPGALVTYVNYPTTEYLELDFLDFCCFNVFLERREPFVAYLHRLQNLAGEKPLVLAEIGLDSAVHGEQAQADLLGWQLHEAFRAACAGAFAFSWTDEWHRGGLEILDWHFGLTDRRRRPKPALRAVSEVFAQVPPALERAPRVSVLVCTYNGSRTLRQTCDALDAVDYPDYEVIVVDDGSTDDSAAIAASYDFRIISTENRGLSSARNTGLMAASGEIVAYLDDDAMPDPDWLTYLVEAFNADGYDAVGGPNLPVPGDGAVADAVAVSPGNPIHVLFGDRDAEHIPGCNSAFRTEALRSIGGFDPQFRAAGDDVDVCWRVRDAGGRIGYSAGAIVWHHRRDTVPRYLKQQRGYGAAEALLERKWPDRYSTGGHVSWRGRLYGESAPRHATGPLRWRVYHGVWGTAPFQALYEPARGEMNTVLLMPELYLAIGALAAIVALGAAWTPLLALAPLLVVVASALAVRAITAVLRVQFPTRELSPAELMQRRALAALLHVAQPMARLQGRLRHGLSPWRRFVRFGYAPPRTRVLEHWREQWTDPWQWLRSFERATIDGGAVVRRGGDFDNWDIAVWAGALAGARVWSTVEEHGSGRQLFRLRCRPFASWPAVALSTVLLALAVVAGLSGSIVAAAVLAMLGALLAARLLAESCSALAIATRSIATLELDTTGDAAEAGEE